jgi:uncharacterized membrane protein YqjE
MSSTGHRDVDLRGPVQVAMRLLGQVRALASDYALLAVLDARSAATRFAWLVCMGLVAAVLVATAWLALLVAGVVWLLGSGASWITALTVSAAINLAAAGVLAYRMRGMTREMPFAATLRQMADVAPNDDQGRVA